MTIRPDKVETSPDQMKGDGDNDELQMALSSSGFVYGDVSPVLMAVGTDGMSGRFCGPALNSTYTSLLQTTLFLITLPRSSRKNGVSNYEIHEKLSILNSCW